MRARIWRHFWRKRADSRLNPAIDTLLCGICDPIEKIGHPALLDCCPRNVFRLVGHRDGVTGVELIGEAAVPVTLALKRSINLPIHIEPRVWDKPESGP